MFCFNKKKFIYFCALFLLGVSCAKKEDKEVLATCPETDLLCTKWDDLKGSIYLNEPDEENKEQDKVGSCTFEIFKKIPIKVVGQQVLVNASLDVISCLKNKDLGENVSFNSSDIRVNFVMTCQGKDLSSLQGGVVGDFMQQGKMIRLESACEGSEKITQDVDFIFANNFSVTEPERGQKMMVLQTQRNEINPDNSLVPCTLLKQADGSYKQEGDCVKKEESKQVLNRAGQSQTKIASRETVEHKSLVRSSLSSKDPWYISGTKDIRFEDNSDENNKILLNLRVTYQGATTSPLIEDLSSGKKYSIAADGKLGLLR